MSRSRRTACGALAAEFPAELPAVLFGALASRALKRLSNEAMLANWQRDARLIPPGRRLT